ncbi:MAG: 7-cyano-7-deazaguanine synthase QueC [Phycisphaerae bacterium]|nr:7-cyano-7-deazaguanine synthase QueC [Phycisphaerae bacterium]
MAPKAVVLLSGGLDSATVLAMAQAQDYELYALTVEYGQRHSREIHCARAQAKARQVAQHKVLHLELPDSRASALTDAAPLPPAQPGSAIPATYVPARNTILLSLALSWAEALEAVDIFIGVTAVDYSGYPDCRAAFIRAFEELANLATKAAVQDGKKFRVHAPLLDLPKHEIIRRGRELSVDFAMTSSCYNPDEQGGACGQCDACVLRLKGFQQAGLVDPARYA